MSDSINDLCMTTRVEHREWDSNLEAVVQGLLFDNIQEEYTYLIPNLLLNEKINRLINQTVTT